MRRMLIGLVTGLVFLALSSGAFAQGISSSEIITHAKDYDNTLVVYQGEVIGDIMVRGKTAWVNVHDGENAIGCLLDSQVAAVLGAGGSYKTKGPWIEVIGTVHRACPAHGGDLDLHASQVRVLTNGRSLNEHLNPGKQNTVFILTGVLCLVLILMRFVYNSGKK